MADIKNIDIIIPTKDNDEDLKTCLDSLFSGLSFESNQFKYSVIIVREHESKRICKQFFDLIKNTKYKDLNIKYIVTKRPVGFAKAVNTALRISLAKRVKPDYIAFLHDDTIIFKGWLQNLINPMLDNVRIVGTGSITANEIDEQCISKRYKLFGIKQTLLNLNEFYEATVQNHTHIQQRMNQLSFYQFNEETTFGKISFFSSVFRTEVFENYGLLDQNLISTYRVEDEFCARLLDNKKTVALVPQAFVHHKCNSLSFNNQNLIDDKKLRDATLFNIKIKRAVNPIVAKKKKQYVVYTYLPCEQTSIINNAFGFHNKDNTDFYCFTDSDKIQSDAWNMINVQKFKEVNLYSNVTNLKQFFKLHPHYFFENYNASIWIDFDEINMIPFDSQEFIRLMDTNTTTLTLEDKSEDCPWKYLVRNYKKDNITGDLYQQILATYRYYNMPIHNGFMNTSVLVRKHNDPICIQLMETIWKYFINTARNDAYWFNFVYWLKKKNYYSIPFNLYQIKMNEVKLKIEQMKKQKGSI